MDILIIDDHDLFSSGLIELLSSVDETLLVKACSSFSAAEKLLKNDLPNLILLDLDLGGECGIDLSLQIRGDYPSIKVAILSGNEDVDVMRQCVENGVVGYITKASPPEVFLKATELLLKDGSYFPSHLMPYLLSNASTAPDEILLKTSKEETLTPRQNEVLSFLKMGKSNKVIAHEMGISEGTVKLHVSTILNKLGVSNRSEAIAKTNV